jgi:hypothetical protein
LVASHITASGRHGSLSVEHVGGSV